MKIISLAQLHQEARTRPAGYLDDVLAHSKLDGPVIHMEDQVFSRLRVKYQAMEDRLTEPSADELVQNFAAAVTGWAAAGFPVSSYTTYTRRAAACAKCPFWNGEARRGLGKCNHQSCGCTRFKRWLQTEKCPIGQWPE